MRQVAAACFVVLGSFFVIAAQTKAEWITYTSAVGRYNVSVPQEPKITAQETTASTGEKLPQLLASFPDGNGVFIVGYFDYASSMTFSFDKARDGMVTAMRGTLIGEEAVSLGASSGRQLKILAKDPNDNEFMDRARVYDVAGRVYVLQCIFPKAEDGFVVVEKCGKFIDSFKLEARP
jgi:hypothetical protein